MTLTYVTEDALKTREEWERCAPNAYQQPDEQVLAMIDEIRHLRIQPKQNRKEETAQALANIDWGQVVANGGPPCFHIDEERFCLRTPSWEGHWRHWQEGHKIHNFVSLSAFCNST